MYKNNLITAASYSPISLQFPNSWIGHVPFAAWLIKEQAPKLFVELGTHSGNSYFSFCQAVAEANLSTKCYAVDTWQGDEHTGYYGEEIFRQVNEHNQEHYAHFSRLLRMNFDDATTYFEDRSIELLHIDGMHSYEEVKHDFDTWLPMLAPWAVVLFHDTNVRERGFGVWKLWEELLDIYMLNIEFVHSHGLGVLQIDDKGVGRQLPYLFSEASEQQMLKNYFSSLGMCQVKRYELKEMHEAVAERDGQIAILNQAVAERDGQIAGLNQALAERDGQIADLNQALVERDGQIAGLNQALAERDGQIADLNQALVERDGLIDGVNRTISILNANYLSIITSTSWRITKPLRSICHQLKRTVRFFKL